MGTGPVVEVEARGLARPLIVAVALALAATGWTGTTVADEVDVGAACVNPTGDAECHGAAMSATGDASGGQAAASGSGNASALVAASGTGDASGDTLSASGTGNATGGVPVSATAGCRAQAGEAYRPCVDAAVEGDARGYYAAASVTGDASADGFPAVAASLTGDAAARCLAASLDRDPDALQGECNRRPPIRIHGDAMLELGRAVGVVNPEADGTAEDPYVIEDWCIEPGVFVVPETVGLRIQNTDAHVVIRDNSLPAPRPEETAGFAHGVEVRNADNVTVTGNRFRENGVGVLAAGADRLTVSGNSFEGDFDAVEVRGSSGVAVAGNAFEALRETGVRVERSTDVTVAHNAYDGLGNVGVTVTGSANVTIEDVEASGGRFGVFAEAVQDLTVTDSTFAGHKWDGISVEGRVSVRVANVTASDQRRDDGITFEGVREATVENTTAAGNDGAGIHVISSSDVELRSNHLVDNAAGDGPRTADLFVTGNEDEVEATGNWCGDPTGPRGGVVDACTGETADGDGGLIATDGDGAGNAVCFDPWLKAPNPQAGDG